MRFDAACKGVLRSAPVTLDPASNLAVVSQVQHKDVLMFLLALKSFSLRVKPAAVYVIDDGSLSTADRAELARQVPGLSLLELPQFQSAACPRGGCWER